MPEAQPRVSDAYRDRLFAHYDPTLVDQLLDWRHVGLPEDPGQAIAYARVNRGGSERPVVYIPGFTEGIIAKAPFAADLAGRDYDVILPDQNRHGILVNDSAGSKDATYSQAMNMLSVLDAEGIEEADFVTHSYGSLVLDEMARQAQVMGRRHFAGSKMILLAPAGFNEQESLPRLAGRFGRSFIAESRTTKDFPDDGDMFKEGLRNAFANPSRTAREVLELSRRLVDYKYLASLGQVAVVSYAEDRLYPYSVIEKRMVSAIKSGVSWSSPVSCAIDGRPHRSGRDASHNDEQFNPGRVAGAVAALLAA